MNVKTGMRILFVQKRYHSNQHHAIKGLLAHGHKVCCLVQNIGPSENHSVLEPRLVAYSPVFLLIESVVYRLLRYRISRPNYGFPSFLPLYREIKNFDPDVIIVRTARLYSQVATTIGRILRKPVVLDNYAPMMTGVRNRTHLSFAKGVVTRLAIRPRVAFTPVSGIFSGEKSLRCGNTYYIPLVVELSPLERVRSYRNDGVVKMLAVGKYQDLPKKRQDLLVEALHKLVAKSYPVSLTFVGSGKETDSQLLHLMKMAHDFNLQDHITFRLNVPHQMMNEVYAAHDVLVLPSRREAYGHAVLEAMASGLPVVASDRAGTSDCIDHGVNGYVFKSDDLDSLTNAIERVIANHETLERMGQESREIVKSRYLPHVYHDRLMYLLKEEFGLTDSTCNPQSDNGWVRASG